MKKLIKTPLATAMGTMVISGFAANVSADSNPFAMSELSDGYMQVAADTGNKVNEGACGSKNGTADGKSSNVKKAEGSCGEGKCGGMMTDGKMQKGMENVCGAMMKNKEGACGMGGKAPVNADKNSKSGEGSCGAMMGGKGGEASCGAMMKGKEGSCGSKVDANKATGK